MLKIFFMLLVNTYMCPLFMAIIWVKAKHVQNVMAQVYIFPVIWDIAHGYCFTVTILNFRTDRSGQTVQNQIRLLLEEQSDLCLHCLLFHLHHFGKIH